jgi:hypothetical protein
MIKMNRYQYKDFRIEVLDEPTFKVGSADNTFNYSKSYLGNGTEEYPTSHHGVKIFQDDVQINNCILIASGGATGIYQNSSLVDNDHLLICCCDTIFCLTLPDLKLKWETQCDQATCFEIYKQEDDYIIRGELQITKLNKDGQIKWEFGGSDIFVSIDNEEEFNLEDDGILLTDFSGVKYKIDFNGKLIWDTSKR